MTKYVGVPPAQTWQLNVSILFEGAEPHTTAEFSAEFDLVGNPELHTSSTSSVEEFMAGIADAISGTLGRTCDVALKSAAVALEDVYPS